MPKATPHVVRKASTADLIAALPSLTGVPVHNSVVIAPFWGKITSSALRINLPQERTKIAYQRHAGVILAHLARLDGCDRVAVAVFTDEPYRVALHGWVDMLTHLLGRVHGAGFHIAEAVIVASDGWGCYPDQTEPRPLTELREAENRIPQRRGRPDLHVLPPTDPDVAAAVTRHVLASMLVDREPDSFGILRPLPDLDPIELFENALAADPDTVGAATLGRLISLMQSEGAVDRTVLQAAFGRDVAAESWDLTLATRARAREAGCQPSKIVERDLLAGNAATERFGRMLLGDTTERPSAARLHRAARLLGRAVAHCQLPERVWVMCALAWVRWAIGLTTAAEDLLRSTAAIEPTNTLVPVYHTIVTHCFPAWIFDRAPGPALNRAARRAATRRGQALRPPG